MEASSLKLMVLQGPRKGETFDFRPGSTVRIGRVVRGNTIAIKEDGISSKHLAIVSESGKWTVKDLDSSNGTFLNSSQSRIPPLQPFDLRDGDEIKFGELTSVMVRIRIENQNQSPPRRGRRKQVTASVEIAEPEARVSAEESQLETAEAENSPPKRGRGRKPRVPASQNVEPPPPPLGGRVTRSKKNEVDCSTSECVELGIPEKKKNAPTRRGRRKQPSPPPVNADAAEIEIKDGHHLGANLDVEAHEGDADRVSVVETKQNSAREAEEGDANRINVAEMKGNEDLRPNLVEEAQQGDRVEAMAETEEEMIQKSDSDEQQQQREAPAMDGRPDSSEHRGNENVELDLEKMTLRDWFKYMEIQFTKQTIEASEKMIDEMRKKAARVQEYMIEQKARNKVSRQ